jgi:anti-sigma regulatory factor (Ser/Thr protein kinase)
MKHAYRGRADRSIRLEGELLPDRVAIRLRHRGEPFDPSSARPPAGDPFRESGFGLYLISRSVDDVRYSHDGCGESCITLVRMLGAGATRTTRCN